MKLNYQTVGNKLKMYQFSDILDKRVDVFTRLDVHAGVRRPVSPQPRDVKEVITPEWAREKEREVREFYDYMNSRIDIKPLLTDFLVDLELQGVFPNMNQNNDPPIGWSGEPK